MNYLRFCLSSLTSLIAKFGDWSSILAKTNRSRFVSCSFGMCFFLTSGTLLIVQFRIQNRGPTPGLVLLVGAVESKDDLKPALRRCFTHTVEVEGPDESRRLSLLYHFLGLTQEVSTDLQQPKVWACIHFWQKSGYHVEMWKIEVVGAGSFVNSDSFYLFSLFLGCKIEVSH